MPVQAPLYMNAQGNVSEHGPGVLLTSMLTLPDTTTLSQYDGVVNRLCTTDGRVWTLATGTFTANPGTIVAATALGANKYWLYTPADGVLNCRMFGGFFDGGTNDAPTIQAAVNYARSLTAGWGGAYRMTVRLPSAWCAINTAIDCTNASGLVIEGSGSSYLNTVVLGRTGGIMFDFTGSSLSGIRNLMLTTDIGWGEAICSNVGVLFALGMDGQGNQTNGLNNFMCNVSMQLADLPIQGGQPVNGGLGAVGMMDIRSEEIHISNVLIRANTPMVFSNKQNLSDTGYNHTVTSPYATVITGQGSMGVVELSGVKLQCIRGRTPALVLNGTNSVNMAGGYMARFTYQVADAYETAVLLGNQATYGLRLHATIETFATILRATNLTENVEINVTISYQKPSAPTAEVFTLTGAEVNNCEFRVSFGNPGDFNNGRIFLYHAPVGGGDSPATGSVTNSVFSCSKWVDNTNFITANLLKRSSNCQFQTGQPFEKRNLTVADRKTYRKPIGTITTGNPDIVATLLRFTKADKTTATAGNGGVYHITVRGTIILGLIYQTGGNCVVDFESRILVSQNQNGNRNPTQTTTVVYNKVLTLQTYLDVVDIIADVDFSGTYAQVRLTVKNSGTGIGEEVSFAGQVEVMSDFLVNQSIILD